MLAKVTQIYTRLVIGLIWLFMSMSQAHAVMIELKVRQAVRAHTEDGALEFKGTLLTSSEPGHLGSVIEIPDQFQAYTKDNKFSLTESLAKWRAATEHTNNPQSPQVVKWSNGNEEVYFPVQIANTGRGSRLLPLTEGQTQYYMTLSGPAEHAHYQVIDPEDFKKRLATENNDSGALTLRPPSPPPLPAITSRPLDAISEAECTSCDRLALAASPQIEAIAAIAKTIRVAQAKPAKRPPEPKVTERVDLYTDPKKALAPSCERIVSKAGKYGDWGRMIKGELERYKAFNQGNLALTKVCPGYDDMAPDTKHDFVIHMLVHLANIESSCTEDAESDPKINPNGVAVGLFQMEQKNELRRNRDIVAERQFGRKVCSGSPYEAKHNISCAIFILQQQLNTQDLFVKGTYWGPFKRKDPPILNALKNYKACWPEPRDAK